MSLASEEKAFADYVVELMQAIGPVSARRMFGGHGLFLDGVMLGLIADNVLYLKVDDETEGEFVDRGLEPFTYHKQGKPFRMSYYQAPDEALEDVEEMRAWANRAYGAALRAVARKRKG